MVQEVNILRNRNQMVISLKLERTFDKMCHFLKKKKKTGTYRNTGTYLNTAMIMYKKGYIYAYLKLPIYVIFHFNQ